MVQQGTLYSAIDRNIVRLSAFWLYPQARTVGVGYVQSAAYDSWPTFHHDVARTGYTAGQAPVSPRILWSYQTAGQIESSPVIANGTVYFSSEDGYFYALNGSTGSLLWRAKTGSADSGRLPSMVTAFTREECTLKREDYTWESISCTDLMRLQG